MKEFENEEEAANSPSFGVQQQFLIQRLYFFILDEVSISFLR